MESENVWLKGFLSDTLFKMVEKDKNKTATSKFISEVSPKRQPVKVGKLVNFTGHHFEPILRASIIMVSRTFQS